MALLVASLVAVWNAGTPGSVTRKTPRLTVTGSSVDEGENAVFTLRLGSASRRPVTVHVATADGSAAAASDYRRYGGTVRFSPGQRSKKVRVRVLDDDEPEAAERFSLRLARVKGAHLGRRQASVTIAENDLPPPFEVRASLDGSQEVEDPPSPTGRGTGTMLLDPAANQATWTLTVTGMTLGDSGICRGLPRRPTTICPLLRFGDPHGTNTVTGTAHVDLKVILEIYAAPGSFCLRATNPDRTEFIRGQVSRA
jgi:hypothetical protein